MSVCLIAGALVSVLASSHFSLSWTHSVEHTEWQERWTLEQDELRLLEARVRGSGAGMDPGAGARLEDGWWVWNPELPPVPELVLAASGTTGGGWTICVDGQDADGLGEDVCSTVGEGAGGPVRLASCDHRATDAAPGDRPVGQRAGRSDTPGD